MLSAYMKFISAIIALFFSATLSAIPNKQVLNSDWKFTRARQVNWYPATVPGTVHTDLMANGIIEDPYFRLNERGVQWVDKEDWIYETTFDVNPEVLSRNNIRLSFDGLDTYADVYINGEKILEANNMFRRWRADIKQYLKAEDNVLMVYFHSPIKVDLPKFDSLPYRYEASNDQSENGGLFDKRLSIFTRKAGYHYGWDWGPRLVTSGIWRPVYIEAWDTAKIENIQYIQKDVNAKMATVNTIVEVFADKPIKGAIVNIFDNDSGKRVASRKSNLNEGLNKVELKFTIRKPELWWTNGLGEAHLYEFRTEVAQGKKIYDTNTDKIGIRSLELVREEDEDGKSFYFVLNGTPLFIKGANYIPCDIFLPRVTGEIYEKTIQDAVDVNMNMLRVWGGGVYEDDLFYDLCDEKGILVWQDFMFACSMYPAEGELLENIRLEAIDNVRRLRNHPSIALWCGNNECQDAWFGWGWKRRLERQNPEYATKVWSEYEDQYYRVLPEVVSEHGSGVQYTPSSPFSGEGIKSIASKGDYHYWGVWHGGEAISEYNTFRSRFFSEYGFQSFPGLESVKRYAPNESDWAIDSEVMMSHQRGGIGANKRIENYLLNEYREPKDFTSFLYMSQVLQGDAIKTAIEAHRRDKGYCWGTLFWQHNDCWPVASWSSRDWYGVWKAQHYFSKYAFADILVSPIMNENTLDIFVVSDRLVDVTGTLTIKVISLNGEEINTLSREILVPANSSKSYFSANIDSLLGEWNREEVVIHTSFLCDNNTYSNNYFLINHKNIDFPKVSIDKSIKAIEGGYEVTLSSDKFARAVFITINGTEHHFSDNFFDLLPNTDHSVTVKTKLSIEEFARQLKIMSIADAIK